MPMPHSRPGSPLLAGIELPEQLLHPAQAHLRAGPDVGRLRVVDQHAPIERGRRDIDARGTQVGHHDVPRVAAERQLPGWSAARARPDLTLDDQAAVEQLAHPLGHDTPAQAGAVDQLRARPGATQPDLVEHR